MSVQDEFNRLKAAEEDSKARWERENERQREAQKAREQRSQEEVGRQWEEFKRQEQEAKRLADRTGLTSAMEEVRKVLGNDNTIYVSSHDGGRGVRVSVGHVSVSMNSKGKIEVRADGDIVKEGRTLDARLAKAAITTPMVSYPPDPIVPPNSD